jgi:hypothetical protein
VEIPAGGGIHLRRWAASETTWPIRTERPWVGSFRPLPLSGKGPSAVALSGKPGAVFAPILQAELAEIIRSA